MIERKKWEELLSDKKKLVWLGAALLLGITLMLIGNSRQKADNIPQADKAQKEESVSQYPFSTVAHAEQILESRLEEILGKIDGAGRVSVTVFLKEGPEYEYAVNSSSTERKIDETDGEGGTRITTEYNEEGNLVLLRTAGEGEKPVIIKEIKPEIRGVLVVAEGAKDPLIKERLTKALQTLFDVSPTKISVLKGR